MDTTADAASASLFASLHETAWHHIASYAAPPDVYNLCLSSVHFFHEVAISSSADAENKQCNVRRSKRKLAAATSSSSNEKKNLFATNLLRTSLLSSLGHVLEQINCGITLSAVLKMGALPEGTALIAGSSMVAACLGKYDWKGDVDVYCSAEGAPLVRSWLVEDADSMFVGVNDGYIDFVDTRLLYTISTKIHHVESWGSTAKNAKDSGKWGQSPEDDEDEYRRKTIQWGKNASLGHAIKNLLGQFRIDTKSDMYAIKPKPGGNLPFDFDGRGEIDLIVAQRGLPASSLLDGFDLEICKASFDGRKFHIPDPHLTFAAKTKMEPSRQAIVGSYVRHHPGQPRYMRPIDMARLASTTISAVRRDVPRTPFYGRLDYADSLPDRYDPNQFFGRGSFMDDMVLWKHGVKIQFHNWVCVLIERLRKYQKRGIEVVDAPMIAEDFEIHKCEHIHH